MWVECNFLSSVWMPMDAILLHRPGETLSVSLHICLLLPVGRLCAIRGALTLDLSHSAPRQAYRIQVLILKSAISVYYTCNTCFFFFGHVVAAKHIAFNMSLLVSFGLHKLLRE